MKYYKLILSSKHEIVIDEIDYKKFESNSGSGNFIKLKQAVINPSFVIAVVPTKEIESGKSIKGYVDPERNVYVVTEEKETPALENAFSNHPGFAQDKELLQ